MFLTTQYLEEAEQLADRVGIIARGKLVAEGTPASLKARVGEPTVHVELADPASAPARARARWPGSGASQPANANAACAGGAADRGRQGGDRPGRSARSTSRTSIVEFVEVETPTLDDVFMAVTGSRLEGAAPIEAA